MSKRKEMFLAKNPHLKRFTKNAIVKNFGVSENEFDQLLKDGFIRENNEDICVGCLRTWNHEYEQCIYCGDEEFGKTDGYYSYS